MPARTGDSMMVTPFWWRRVLIAPALMLPLLFLSGCATLGSAMSPYSEKFSCKNSDHGQCIHPDQAYADAVAGRASRSDPAVTNDKKLLSEQDREARKHKGHGKDAAATPMPAPAVAPPAPAYTDLAGGIANAGTPMLRPSQTVRTLILPYADRQRPDRLYMSRYVYSMLGRPTWVVGSYLIEPVGRAPNPPVLRSSRDSSTDPSGADAGSPGATQPPVPTPDQEPQP